MDHLGHGTGMAGIILQVAPCAQIIPLKINPAGENFFETEALERALWYILDLAERIPGLKIVNMSLTVSEMSQGLEQVVGEFHREGFILITAAGNDGTSAQPLCLYLYQEEPFAIKKIKVHVVDSPYLYLEPVVYPLDLKAGWLGMWAYLTLSGPLEDPLKLSFTYWEEEEGYRKVEIPLYERDYFPSPFYSRFFRPAQRNLPLYLSTEVSPFFYSFWER